MLEDVKNRLAALGYTVEAADDWVLGFVIDKVEQHIKTQTNLSEFPEELRKIAVDRAAGELLLSKKNSGQLTGFTLDIAVKSIKTGDTTTTFEDSTPDAKMNALLNYLLRENYDFASYRVIKW